MTKIKKKDFFFKYLLTKDPSETISLEYIKITN